MKHEKYIAVLPDVHFRLPKSRSPNRTPPNDKIAVDLPVTRRIYSLERERVGRRLN